MKGLIGQGDLTKPFPWKPSHNLLREAILAIEHSEDESHSSSLNLIRTYGAGTLTAPGRGGVPRVVDACWIIPRSLRGFAASARFRNGPLLATVQASMKTIFTAVLLAIAASSFADDFNLLGAWRGRREVHTPPLPASASPRERARYNRSLAEMRGGRLSLTMYRDHRYTIHNVGLPTLGPADTRGIWSKRGSTLSLIRTGTSKPFLFVVDTSGSRLTSTRSFGSTTAQFVFNR